jgi:hypothetical protein
MYSPGALSLMFSCIWFQLRLSFPSILLSGIHKTGSPSRAFVRSGVFPRIRVTAEKKRRGGASRPKRVCLPASPDMAGIDSFGNKDKTVTRPALSCPVVSLPDTHTH